MNTNDVPVIAIDGPSASGKGTVAQRVAAKLGFHYLDSGALYRLVALATMRAKVDLGDERTISDVAAGLDVVFKGEEIRLGNESVTDAIRTEACGNSASRIAAYPLVRAALLARQRAFCQLPGLVADGRDMGSVVFPDAILKIFLTATAETRAQRRHKQLMEKGIGANIATLLQDIRDRDARDS
ncbi:MAG: (d)CMP kinase, partial [Nitrosospira sp.]